MRRIGFLALFLFAAFQSGYAQAGDIPGSSDHPVIGRIPGASIIAYKHLPNAVAKFPLERQGRYKFKKIGEATGELWKIAYRLPRGTDAASAIAVYRQRLADLGFEELFTCSNDNTIFYRKLLEAIGEDPWEKNTYKIHCLVSRGNLKNQPTVVAVYATSLVRNKKSNFLRLHILQSKPLETKLDVVGAEQIAADIEAKGRIALYGIEFDHDSARLRSSSRPTLKEIAKYLASNPGVKLYVVGHTDNTGTYDYNLGLSRRRAAAVVKALTGSHGVSAQRLKAVGVGPVAPLASNATEEGRARNRRVELVPQ